jgi:plastocyanin
MGRTLLIAGILLATASTAAGQGYYPEPSQPQSDSDGTPAAEVDANGNAVVPGSLGFDPVEVSVKVGEIVRWTNTDSSVPHTATEDHGLWRLSGTYGSPGPFQGFGPGESVERRFEAGTHHYYCEVHPEQMRAVVKVPVSLTRLRDRRARIRWSATAPADGLSFDVQRRRNRGAWKPFRRVTTARTATFALGERGTHWGVRARLRSATDRTKATGWSPVATIR